MSTPIAKPNDDKGTPTGLFVTVKGKVPGKRFSPKVAMILSRPSLSRLPKMPIRSPAPGR